MIMVLYSNLLHRTTAVNCLSALPVWTWLLAELTTVAHMRWRPLLPHCSHSLSVPAFATWLDSKRQMECTHTANIFPFFIPGTRVYNAFAPGLPCLYVGCNPPCFPCWPKIRLYDSRIDEYDLILLKENAAGTSRIGHRKRRPRGRKGVWK